ncbi:adenylate/guanylate cyclase domain-containing protein [Mesorhizobium sp. BAC0120]|uniref:adenylate/guanylate cyclase domain-containing protein n=1 Tax=Mesorhizobium sp. BAC0120 TaxID=3090670 RepID=UPI00298C89C8|nr:adenylate/guanylate cyclase domain-containing protein [Mesorhizobium sp. BAC0120]MDW6022892.1 adenylate/guanylate cyclase domain-containing protein [Mesorhizobium sp. BAC0120]
MWLTYQQGTRTALDAAAQQMRLLSAHAIERYRSTFGTGYSAIALTSANEAFLREPPADMEVKVGFLSTALSASPDIDGMYVGYPSGAFVHAVNISNSPAWKKALSAPQGAVLAARTIEGVGPSRQSKWRFYDANETLISERVLGDASYDPRTRPWYKAASRSGGPAAVGPYVMATTGVLGLTIAMPMERDQKIVVGADVVLETISRLLSREAVSAHSVGYVFDDRKRLIVHSDAAKMARVLASLEPGDSTDVKIDDPVLDAVQKILESPSYRAGEALHFTVGGEPYLAEMATTGNSELLKGNTVVIAAPVSDFTKPSIDLLRKALAIAGALLAIGIILSVLVARLVSRSLSVLTSDAEQIGNLDLRDQGKLHSHVAEINTLASALSAARRAIGTFALYMPRELVRRIVASGQAVAGSAVRQEITVLFTDIRDFTTISESRTPEEVVALLSTYFELMNGIVERHGGVIVQYLGDSIYAMWNAPDPDPDHVDNACRCTLTLKAGIDALNEGNRMAGLPQLITRFGLHTGVAVVGSVGAMSRRQYTAMGDTVNVASRLEGLNKEFGTSILASRAVRERADRGFCFRPLGLAQAKGRHEQIDVFELIGATSASEVTTGTGASAQHVLGW